jgi:hypothetical protein
MDVKYGVIQGVQLGSAKVENARALAEDLVNLKLHEIQDWDAIIGRNSSNHELDDLISFLKQMLPPSSHLAGIAS